MKEWLVWFEEQQDSKSSAPFKSILELLSAGMREVDELFSREITRIVFALSVFIALAAAYDYLWLAPWPAGSAYFCQLPYFLSIVSFAPFAVPMMLCLTVVAHTTFVEATFGKSVAHRDAAGTVSYSPLPRDPVSLTASLIVIVLFVAWATAAVVALGPVVFVFSPVLLVPGFILPMAVMYLPSATLDAVSSNLRHRFVIKAALARTLSFGETVLILKGATTQVLSLFMLAVPMLPFLDGRYEWADAAEDLLSVTTRFDLPTIKLAFAVTLSFPDFAVPRLNWYLGISLGLIAGQLALEGESRSPAAVLRVTCELSVVTYE